MNVVVVFATLGVASALAPIPHPTLPTMWLATTSDPPMGVGIESYYFVDSPTDDNPSCMWSNYTDCERLIWDGGYAQTRYLLKCDSVDCCKETDDGNQVEFQIPNVHPPELAKNFSMTSNQQVDTEFGTVTCDVYSWSFVAEKWSVCVSNCSSCVNQVMLYQWHVQAFTEIVSIDFKDFKGIAESDRKTFAQTFAIPKVCQGNILDCPSERKAGKLRPRKPSPSERLQQWREEVYAKHGQKAPALRMLNH